MRQARFLELGRAIGVLSISGTIALTAACRVGYDPIGTLDLGEGGVATTSGGSSAAGGTSTSGGASAGGSGGGNCTVTNGGIEICDGLDNDCSGVVDNGATCLMNCRGIAFGANGYQFCEAEIAWQSAVAACETQGMHLVKITSDAENTFVGTTAFATGIAFVWLGGDDITAEGSWHWRDGALFWTGPSSGSAPAGIYTHWYINYPGVSGTTDCLEMRDDFTWDDKQCSQGKRYVCEL